MALEPQPFIEAIAAIRRQVSVLPETYYGAIPAKNRALAFTVSGLAGIDQIRAVHETLIRAQTENGWSFTRWKEAVSGGEINLGLPDHRLELIYRNAMQGAWNRGRAEQIQRNTRTHPYLLYSAINDSRTRPAHAEMHGTILPVDDPWWQSRMPQNGHNCRCQAIALTRKEAERRGVTTAPTTAEPDNGWSTSALAGNDLDGYRNAIDRRAADPAARGAAPVIREMRARLDDPAAFAQTVTDVVGNRQIPAAWGVSGESGAAIHAYRTTSEVAQNVNNVMRYIAGTGRLTVANPDRYLPVIDGLYKAFRELPKAPGVVRRNLIATPRAMVKGEVVRFSTPLATAAQGGAVLPGKTTLIIQQRSGVAIRDMPAGNVLLPPGTPYIVERTRQTGGRTTIWLRELDEIPPGRRPTDI